MRVLLTVLALLLVAGLVWLWQAPTPSGVHISGDGADAVASTAPDAASARVEVVLLAGWDRLQHVPGAAALCGTPCFRADPPVLVRAIGLLPRPRKRVLLHLGLGREGVEMERGGPILSEAEAACRDAWIAAEAAELEPDAPEGCGQALTRWRLTMP